MIGYCLALIIYIVGFYPIIRDTINATIISDSTTASLFSLIPAVILIAMMIGLLTYAFGKRPSGAWGGE